MADILLFWAGMLLADREYRRAFAVVTAALLLRLWGFYGA